jgi:hypothetical protein
MKKAQGMSMNVIIIAALALLVLVVLSVIFLTRAGVFSRETVNCRQQGGLCVPTSEDCPTSHPTGYNSWKCLQSDGKVDDTAKCCITG